MMYFVHGVIFFFFSSRRRHTRYWRDWSSDVCSSDLYKDFAAALPDAKLYGPDGVAESGFADPKEGGIPASVGRRVKVTVATLDPESYPPEGQEFFTQFEQEYGEKNPDPYAIYGYEAARLALDAIERAGSANKEDVLKALFDTKDRQSVLGTYSIDENGDRSEERRVGKEGRSRGS